MMNKDVTTQEFISVGNGKKILIFLHYFGGDANCWQWVMDALSAQFTCIAFNLPGCGKVPFFTTPSIAVYAAYLQEKIKQLNVGEYSVVGHSMGGKIALQMACNDKENAIKQLILLAPSPPDKEVISTADQVQLLAVPVINEAEQILKKLAIKSLSAHQLRVAINAQLTTLKEMRQWWVKEGSQQSILHLIPAINCPVAIIAAEDDPAITYTTVLNEVVNVLRSPVLITIKNCGHLYPFEVPEMIATVIKSTLLTKGKIMVE